MFLLCSSFLLSDPSVLLFISSLLLRASSLFLRVSSLLRLGGFFIFTLCGVGATADVVGGAETAEVIAGLDGVGGIFISSLVVTGSGSTSASTTIGFSQFGCPGFT